MKWGHIQEEDTYKDRIYTEIKYTSRWDIYEDEIHTERGHIQRRHIQIYKIEDIIWGYIQRRDTHGKRIYMEMKYTQR